MGVPPQIELGNLGMADSLILMVLALVVFGPRRLPQIGRQIGKLMYEFRKASNDFKYQMEEELRLAEDADRRKKEEAERARNLALNPPAPPLEAEAAIGADDQASVSGQSSVYESPSSTAPEPSPAEEAESRYPRINPPSTGEPIPAERPSAAAAESAASPAPPASAAGESGNGIELSPGAPEPPPAPSASDPTHTETVTHHG